jgi:ketosteroid isomerase-like protein
MSDSNVELIRRQYELWNEGNFDAAFAPLAEDVVAIGHPQLPDPGPVHGRQAVRAWMEGMLEPWDELAVDLEELTERDDQVFARVRFRGRGRGSGAEVVSGLDTHVWTLRGGEVTAIRWHQGTVDIT